MDKAQLLEILARIIEDSKSNKERASLHLAELEGRKELLNEEFLPLLSKETT